MISFDEDTQIALDQFRQTKMAAIEKQEAQIKNLTLLLMKCHNEISRWNSMEGAIEDAIQREDKEQLEELLFQFLMEDAF